MSSPTIRSFALGKKYFRVSDRESRLIGRLRARRKGTAFWALRSCTFEVHRGEVVGIIGTNGAGKSTLLKVLSRITRPNEGRAEIYGRIGSLLEVGTGFHPELTGRENIFLNGALIGMQRSEIQRNFESIVEFAGVADWIDTPIKRYSSGMKVRLAFAVAAHLEQEIMIIDEVLAVGDSAFRRKCFKKIDEVMQQGRTVLLVSHELPSLATTCTRTIWLEAGHIREDGIAANVIDSYLRSVVGEKGVHRGFLPLEANKVELVGPGLQLRYIRLLDGDDNQVPCFATGETAKFAIGYEASDPALLERTTLKLTIFNAQRHALTSCESRLWAESRPGSQPTRGEFICAVEKLPLMPGQYSLDLACRTVQRLGQQVAGAGDFQVVSGISAAEYAVPQPGSGDVILDHRWSIREAHDFHDVS